MTGQDGPTSSRLLVHCLERNKVPAVSDWPIYLLAIDNASGRVRQIAAVDRGSMVAVLFERHWRD